MGIELHFKSIRSMLFNALQPPFPSIGTRPLIPLTAVELDSLLGISALGVPILSAITPDSSAGMGTLGKAASVT